MHILVCSDGSQQAEDALRFAGLIATGDAARITLLGVVENSGDETPLLDTLTRGMKLVKDQGIGIELVTRSGDPVREIQKHTALTSYELVLIGAAHKGHSGPFIMSMKACELIKVIAAPVLVVSGRRNQLKSVLVCSGGKSYIDQAIALTGKIALGAGAAVTLLHVLPDTPAMYANLMDRTEDREHLLASNSELGRNLRREKEVLESLGVKTDVKVRHGDVPTQIISQIRDNDYDLVVTGSSPVNGRFRTYLMGNVTSEIVNRSQRPVLVVRGAPEQKPRGFWSFFRRSER